MAAGMQRMYEILIKLKDEVSGSLKNIENNATKMEKNLKSGTEGMSRSFMGLRLSTLAAAVSIGSLALGLKKVLTAAVEANYVETQLANSMKRTGTYTEKAYKDAMDYAGAMANTSKYTDDAIMSTMTYALNLGVTGKNLEWVANVSAGYASKMGKDLPDATRIVTAALKGNVIMLQRMFPELRNCKTEAERTALALKLLTERFGGGAQEEMNTYAAQITNVKNTMDEVAESIGKALIVQMKSLVSNSKDSKEALKDLKLAIVDLGAFVVAMMQTLTNTIPTFFADWWNSIELAIVGAYDRTGTAYDAMSADVDKKMKDRAEQSKKTFEESMQFFIDYRTAIETGKTPEIGKPEPIKRGVGLSKEQEKAAEDRYKIEKEVMSKLNEMTLDETAFKLAQLEVWYKEQEKAIDENFKNVEEKNALMFKLHASVVAEQEKIDKEATDKQVEFNRTIKQAKTQLELDIANLTLGRVEYEKLLIEKEKNDALQAAEDLYKEKRLLGLITISDEQNLANLKAQIEIKYYEDSKVRLLEQANNQADIYRDQAKVYGSYLEGMGVGWEEYWESVAKTGEQGVQMMGEILGGLHDVISNVVFSALKGEMIDFKKYWEDYWDRILKVYAEQQADNFMKNLMKVIEGSDILSKLGLGDIIKSAEKAKKSPTVQKLDEQIDILKEIRDAIKGEKGVVTEPVVGGLDLSGLQKAVDNISPSILESIVGMGKKIGGGISSWFTGPESQQAMKQISKTMGKGVGGEITDYFQQIFGGGQGLMGGQGWFGTNMGRPTGVQGPTMQGGQFFSGAGGGGVGASLIGAGMSAFQLYQTIKSGGGGMGGAASGAMSGAQLGTMVLPGWGTAIGAVAGGVAGYFGGGGEEDAEKRKKRGENFKKALSDWMNAEYETLTAMITAWPEELRSKKGLQAAGGDKWPLLYTLFEQLSQLADQAQTFGQTSVTAFSGMMNSLHAVSLAYPDLADEIKKTEEKMKKAFEAETLAKFEEGTYSLQKALRQLERSGMDPVTARAKLLGESFNELTLALGGTIDAASDGAEFFAALDDVLDELMEDFNRMPQTMNETKAQLMSIVYVIQVLSTTISTFLYFLEDLAEFPEIFEDLDKALKAGDFDKAADEVSRLSDAFMSAASSMAEMVTRLEEVGASGAAEALSNLFEPWMKAFYTIGLILGLVEAIFRLMGLEDESAELFHKIWLGILKSVQDVFEFLKGIVDFLASIPIIGELFKPAQEVLQDIIDNLQDMIDETQAWLDLNNDAMSLYDYWEDLIEKMSKAELVKPILDAVKSWQTIIDEIHLGPIRVQMKEILEDMLYNKMLLAEALDEGVIDEEQYAEAIRKQYEATQKAITDYFDDLLDAFDDFRYDLQKDIKELRLEGYKVQLSLAKNVKEIEAAVANIAKTFDNMIADVEARMFKVMKDMTSETAKSWRDFVKFSEEMDPQEYLDNAGKLRDLILERYELEKQKIEETLHLQIDSLEELEDSWKSVFETLDDMILDMETSAASPADILDRLAKQAEEVEEKRREYAGATGAERAEASTELAQALQEYLTLSQEAYQRPSVEYQAIYDSVLSELKALREEAQAEYTKAEAAIIDLLGESRDIEAKIEELTAPYRQETLAALQALDLNMADAEQTLKDMKDLYLSKLSLDVEDLKKFLEEELTYEREKRKFTEALSDESNPTWDVVDKLADTNDLINSQTIELMNQTSLLGLIEYNTREWWEKLPKFQHGIENIPYTMPAVVHQGETIIPAGTARGITINLGGINVSGAADGKKVAQDISEGIMREVKYGKLGDVIEERVRKAG